MRSAQEAYDPTGLHHVHHLSARIPNYNLQKCHEAESLFQQVRTMTLASSLRSLPLRLRGRARQTARQLRARATHALLLPERPLPAEDAGSWEGSLNKNHTIDGRGFP